MWKAVRMNGSRQVAFTSKQAMSTSPENIPLQQRAQCLSVSLPAAVTLQQSRQEQRWPHGYDHLFLSLLVYWCKPSPSISFILEWSQCERVMLCSFGGVMCKRCGVAFKEQFYLGPVDSSRRLNTYSGRRQTPPQTFFMISILETSVLSWDRLTAARFSSRMLTVSCQCEVATNSVNDASQWHKSIHQFSTTTYPAVGLWSLHPSCVKVKASSSSQGRPAKHA